MRSDSKDKLGLIFPLVVAECAAPSWLQIINIINSA